MATSTLLPGLAVDFAKTMAGAFETTNVEELTSEEVSRAISMCVFLQDLFAQSRRSIEEELAQGVDSRTFAAKYEQAVVGLKAVMTTTQRVVEKVRAEQFVSSYQALMDDISSLYQFLVEAVAKAKMPARPVDWNRVKKAEAAYASGQTKPVQRSCKI